MAVRLHAIKKAPAPELRLSAEAFIRERTFSPFTGVWEFNYRTRPFVWLIIPYIRPVCNKKVPAPEDSFSVEAFMRNEI